MEKVNENKFERKKFKKGCFFVFNLFQIICIIFFFFFFSFVLPFAAVGLLSTVRDPRRAQLVPRKHRADPFVQHLHLVLP